jgi:hypothetical protein
MDSAFRDMLEGLKQTTEGLVQANVGIVQASEGIVQANEGIKKSVEAALRANDEHEDVRETVHRLEALVLDLVSKMTPPPDPSKA